MASFSSAAFSTSAFSVSAFDFGGAAPAPAAITQPTGGWETRRQDPFFTPRKWSVKTEAGETLFDTPDEAHAFLEAQEAKERPVGKVIRIGKAAIVSYGDKPINAVKAEGHTGIDIFRKQDERLLKMLIRMIENQIIKEEIEEQEALLLIAASI